MITDKTITKTVNFRNVVHIFNNGSIKHNTGIKSQPFHRYLQGEKIDHNALYFKIPLSGKKRYFKTTDFKIHFKCVRKT